MLLLVGVLDDRADVRADQVVNSWRASVILPVMRLTDDAAHFPALHLCQFARRHSARKPYVAQRLGTIAATVYEAIALQGRVAAIDEHKQPADLGHRLAVVPAGEQPVAV